MNLEYIIYLFLVVIIFVIFYYYFNKKTQEGVTNIVNMKTNENGTKRIPLNIYQTWKTLNLPTKMKKCVDYVKHQNPEFKHYLYDDEMCASFIKKHFSKEVFNTYNKLKPGAYKADLWRYCVLYINGGIYMDIKFQNIPGFKLIGITEKEHYVRDLMESGGGIYNAFIVSYPNNPSLLEAIKQIVKNTENNYYGEGPLSPTGPVLLKKIFTSEQLQNMEMTIGDYNGELCIFYKNVPILTCYKGYRDEQIKTKNYKPYSYLWDARDIYFK